MSMRVGAIVWVRRLISSDTQESQRIRVGIGQLRHKSRHKFCNAPWPMGLPIVQGVPGWGVALVNVPGRAQKKIKKNARDRVAKGSSSRKARDGSMSEMAMLRQLAKKPLRMPLWHTRIMKPARLFLGTPAKSGAPATAIFSSGYVVCGCDR